jgi:hypothetical protein
MEKEIHTDVEDLPTFSIGFWLADVLVVGVAVVVVADFVVD